MGGREIKDNYQWLAVARGWFGWHWLAVDGRGCWRTVLESGRGVALKGAGEWEKERRDGELVDKTKTTNLDKDHLIWIVTVPNEFLWGTKSLSDDLLPIHLRCYAMQSSKEMIDWYLGDCRQRIGKVSKLIGTIFLTKMLMSWCTSTVHASSAISCCLFLIVASLTWRWWVNFTTQCFRGSITQHSICWILWFPSCL